MGTGRRKGREARLLARRRPPSAENAGPSFFVAPVGDDTPEGNTEVPDLLHAEPRAWGDLRGSASLVRFGFEGGDTAFVFDTLIRALPVGPHKKGGASAAAFASSTALASQLYLNELIASCLSFQIGTRRYAADAAILRRILTVSSTAPEDVATRQAVLRDLQTSSKLRSDLERLYVAVRGLRESIEATDAVEPNVIRRKVAVLVALQTAVNALADGFETEASVLSRLRTVGGELRAEPAWQRLESLVRTEAHIANVDVRLRLGSDGSVRGFEVLSIAEIAPNDVFPGPLTRLFQRFVSFLRGYRYGETEVVVRLLEEVFAPWTEAVVVIQALTGALEFYLAFLGFHDLAVAKGLRVSLPTLVAESELPAESDAPTRVLEGLFNPLLLLQGVVPRPVDLPPSRHDALVVLTGPNSGGKTRLLQSLALAQLLAQAGGFVPAKRAELVIAPRIFLSLGAEEAADQVEGRLGTELLRVRRLFEDLQPGALAILDELCSGTNPLEGEAIFETVLTLLAELSPQVFVSTHFLGLAERLARDRPIARLSFLQVDLDEHEQPTFQFRPGVATTSLAHKVAERLGVTRDALRLLVDAKRG